MISSNCIKNNVKNCVGVIRCWLNGISKYGRNVYLGKGCTVRAKRSQIIFGSDVDVKSNTTFLCVTPGASIRLGDDIRIQYGSTLSSARSIEIESHVNFGPYCFITDHNHTFEDIEVPIIHQDPLMTKVPLDAKVLIKSGTWIGTKVTIAGSVTIGKHCVIGANSVVTKDIPDYSVAAGIPAKVLKQYNFETKKWERVK